MDDFGDEFNAAVAAELRAQRGRTKLTIDSLATRTGLSKSAVLNYLNAKRDIPMPAFHSLTSALGISPASVMEFAEHAIADHGGYALAASDDDDWQRRQEAENE